MGIVKKIVKLKEQAFAKGTYAFNQLQNHYNNYIIEALKKNLSDASSVVGVNISGACEQTQNKFIGLNCIEATKYIYTHPQFYEYLKYSFLGKYYEKKLNLITWFIILIAVLIGIIIYIIFGLGIIFGITVIGLIIVLYIIFKFFFKTGESYKSYYERTMMDFLYQLHPNVSYSYNSKAYLGTEEIKEIINKVYTKSNFRNGLSFSSSLASGKVLDMKLIKTTERKNQNGTVTKTDETFFDGFYLKININHESKFLRGNVIKIKEDENILSSLAEDTVRGIYESDLEFSFNSEEMNKSFDCKISGYNGFNDVDEMMMQVHKIITPSFEQHLLYLRERYNSFNMNISDDGIVATFHMKRSLFQKAKHNEVFDLKKTYREANEDFRMLRPDLNGINDFAYYNVFPFVERLYFMKYLTYLYLSYFDFENYYNLNNENITTYEEEMKNIYTMDIKEFKESYTDKIKEIKRETKETAKTFELEEK